MKWVFLVVALFALELTWAMKLFRGPCPQNMTAMKNLDINNFMGKWYIHSKYPPIPDKVSRCQSVVFRQDNETNPYIEKRMLSSQTDTVVFQKAEILKWEPEAGRYVQDTKNKAFPKGIQIYILDTDYTNYAIRFMCFDTNKIFSFHWAVLQFRRRVPNAEVVYNAQKIARENGVKISLFVNVPQNACPSDT
ncbi:apolipoprotein D [Drosophila serrata]|uniref:apolipoprotein D n=1 Tax=Drosophila serrata TaxID=7274 RepID=UPI000A1D1AE7|nr:apolipoprotein D [Drosophila serrata]